MGFIETSFFCDDKVSRCLEPTIMEENLELLCTNRHRHHLNRKKQIRRQTGAALDFVGKWWFFFYMVA